MTVLKLTAALALAGFAAMSQAASTTVSLGNASGYNGYFFGNYQTGSGDVEGRLAVGGNLTSSGGFSVGAKASNKDVNLSVGGNILAKNGGSVQLEKGKGIYGGTTAQVPAWGHDGLSASQIYAKSSSVAASIAASKTTLTQESSLIGSLKATGTVRYGQSMDAVLTGSGNGKVQVFNLNAADLGKVTSFSVSGVAKDAFVFVNIFGSNVNLTGNFDAFKTFTANNSTRVMFNLPGATSLSLKNMWLDAAVLAPKANIGNSSGHINGPLIANSFTNSPSALELGAMNYVNGAQIAAVPEPETYALMGLGLTAMVLRLRRRKTA